MLWAALCLSEQVAQINPWLLLRCVPWIHFESEAAITTRHTHYDQPWGSTLESSRKKKDQAGRKENMLCLGRAVLSWNANYFWEEIAWNELNNFSAPFLGDTQIQGWAKVKEGIDSDGLVCEPPSAMTFIREAAWRNIWAAWRNTNGWGTGYGNGV